MSDRFGLTAMGMVCALGTDSETIYKRAMAGDTTGMEPCTNVLPDGDVSPFGYVHLTAEQEQAAPARCEALLLASVEQIRSQIEQAVAEYTTERIGIVIGTSNSTMEEFTKNPDHIDMATPSSFLKEKLQLKGPAFVISTACSSSSKVFGCARKLLVNGLCDAVIVGGVDSFARIVENGFYALEALSLTLTRPMGKNRDGINLGEGAALFLMEKNKGKIFLAGVGESSDAYHLTAPHPGGRGAEQAMRAALADAGLKPEEIDTINLHGTGTVYNDQMESRAIERIFGLRPICCSTKPMTGHTLGAAGAIELGLCWLMLDRQRGIFPHVLNDVRDDELPQFPLAEKGNHMQVRTVLSNSFAFGGSNASVILERDAE